jgi:DNA polymerase-3 subunit gamma/tau
LQEKSRPRSTLLKDLLKTNDEKKDVHTNRLQEGNSDFSQEDLQKYWIEYANTLDIKKIHLKNTLLNCKPKLEKDFSFEVGVYNPAQKEEISENISAIINYLISKLNNSHIKMTIHIMKQDKKEMIYTATEKFNYLINKNPFFGELVDTFELAIK